MIFNVMRYSVNDGPGIRTTVFLKGCPLNCKWCHNPESIKFQQELVFREERCRHCGECISVCSNGAIRKVDGRIVTLADFCIRCGRCVDACVASAREMAGSEMSTQQVMTEICKDRVFFDQSGGCVTFSGGEPLAQPAFLCELLQECQQMGIHTAVDTSGYAAPAVLESVAPFVDLFLYDLKLMDDARHREWTGVSNQLVLQNLQRLSRNGKKIVIRLPIIPRVNDDDENIFAVGDFVASLGSILAIHLLPYHQIGVEKYHRLGRQYEMHETKPPSFERMNYIIDLLRNFLPQVIIGGWA